MHRPDLVLEGVETAHIPAVEDDEDSKNGCRFCEIRSHPQASHSEVATTDRTAKLAATVRTANWTILVRFRIFVGA
jgi:hypothetical protein